MTAKISIAITHFERTDLCDVNILIRKPGHEAKAVVLTIALDVSRSGANAAANLNWGEAKKLAAMMDAVFEEKIDYFFIKRVDCVSAA